MLRDFKVPGTIKACGGINHSSHGFSVFFIIISLVAAGLGIALVPACIQTFQRPDVIYLPLQGVVPLAEIQVVWQRAERLPVVHNFLDVVNEQMQAETVSLPK